MSELLISHELASFCQGNADIIAEVRVQITRDGSDIDGDYLQIRVRLPGDAASKAFAELQ